MSQCLCRPCGKTFKSVYAFDMHRTGSYSKDTRRCMNTEEMREAGMDVNARGVWVSERQEAQDTQSIYSKTT